MNRYETTESFYNALMRRQARHAAAQAVADAAAAATNREFPIEKMKGSPRLPNEDLISYELWLKGGAK
jgi:hypothetical protein